MKKKKSEKNISTLVRKKPAVKPKKARIEPKTKPAASAVGVAQAIKKEQEREQNAIP